jgi:hypothetical protein
MENKQSNDIGTRLTLIVKAYADARRRRKRFNVGRVFALDTPPSYRPAEEEEEIQRRSSACSQQRPQTDACSIRRRSRRSNVGRVLVINMEWTPARWCSRRSASRRSRRAGTGG